MTPAVLLVLVAFAIYSLLSKAISRSLLTLPIIFTALGFALSVVSRKWWKFESDVISG